MRQHMHDHTGADHLVQGDAAGSGTVGMVERAVHAHRPGVLVALAHTRAQAPISRRSRSPRRPRPRATSPVGVSTLDPVRVRAADAVLGRVGGVARSPKAPARRACAPIPPRRAASLGLVGRGTSERTSPDLHLVVSPPAPAARLRTDRLRRAAAGLALALAAAALVIGLGRLADGVTQLRTPAATGGGASLSIEVAPIAGAVADVSVTVRAPGTVWDVVDAVAPGAPGAQRAALVDRVVTANHLSSVRVAPGQVLRVPLRS